MSLYYFYAGYCWIGLQDYLIRIAIQFSVFYCDCQFKVKIGIWIWIVNPVFFISIQIQKSSNCICIAILIQKNVSLLNCGLKNISLGNYMFSFKNLQLLNFSKSYWIVIGFALHCQSILKRGWGFGLKITYLWWIWIGLTTQKNRIVQLGLQKYFTLRCF